MIDEGADIVDVGGESTRPGAEPVPVGEELRRVIPVIEALAGRVRVSIDTTKEEVAEAAVGAGATLINDVSASLWPVAARHRVGWVAMHRQGTPPPCRQIPATTTWWPRSPTCWSSGRRGPAGPGWTEVWIDPGIGFGKTVDHNLRLLGIALPTWWPPGTRCWWGPAARVSWVRWPDPDGDAPVPVGDRLPGSLATATWAMSQGARMVRVHDVAATVQAAQLVGPSETGAGRRRVVPPRPRPAPTGAIVRWPGEGQVGGGHPATQLHLGDQGSPGHEREAGRLRPQPPQGAPPGGDHLAPGPGVHPGDLVAAFVAQSPGLRGEVDGQCALPAAALR